MPRLAANLNYLFNEVDLLERFEAAAQAGFRGVEYQFPYEYDERELAQALRAERLEMVLMNLPAGDIRAGDAGIGCDPARVEEFREGVEKGIAYARALGCPRLNCLAGIAPPAVGVDVLRETFVENLRFAAARLAAADVQLLIEPINTRDRPGFFLSRTTEAIEIIEETGADNLYLQFDVYHVQVMQGDVVNNFDRHREHVRHVQIADNPGRHEPGTGELNFPFILSAIDDLGYRGWVSCEYAPSSSTEESLGWAREFLEKR